MKKCFEIIALLSALFVLCCGCSSPNNESQQSLELKNRGFYSIKNEVAEAKTPDDAHKAVQNLLDQGKSLDLTGIELQISKPLVLYNQNIYGGKITYTAADGQPILKIAGKCNISNVDLYQTGASIECGEGKYVGIWLSNDKGKVTEGTLIRNVRFFDVGTLIYAPKDVKAAACGMSVENIHSAGMFRGVDLQSEGCSGNSFCNFYMTSCSLAEEVYTGKVVPGDSQFYLNGSENTVMKQINIEHCSLKRPIIFENCKGINASTIHIEGMNIGEEGRGFVNLYNSDVRIGSIDIYWTRIYSKNCSVIALGNAKEGGSNLEVETFLIKGVNDPGLADPGIVRGIKDGIGDTFKMMSRSRDCKNPYYVTINNYSYFTFQNDLERLENFVADYDTIEFKRIGQLPAGGDTANRPTKRLCKGYTEYYDTTLQKTVIWNGTNWE